MPRYRNYEVAAFPFGQLEYGGGGYIGGVDGKSVPLPFSAVPDREQCGFFAQGYAVRWHSLIDQGLKRFWFTRYSIRTPLSNDVRFQFDHNDNDVIGSTRDGSLCLHAEDHGLAVRFKFRDEPNHRRAYEKIKDESYTSLSIGCKMDSIEIDVDGVKVRRVSSARLEEVSLCKTGACRPAFITLIKADDAFSLEHDAKSLRVLSDGAAHAFVKSLDKLKSQLASSGR
jgi:HK97 family phage prohead protease